MLSLALALKISPSAQTNYKQNVPKKVNYTHHNYSQLDFVL